MGSTGQGLNLRVDRSVCRSQNFPGGEHGVECSSTYIPTEPLDHIVDPNGTKGSSSSYRPRLQVVLNPPEGNFSPTSSSAPRRTSSR